MKIKLAKSELIHFVGIGGIGMSGLSLIMKGKGFKVQGSDISNNKNIERLKKEKIKISQIFGHQNFFDQLSSNNPVPCSILHFHTDDYLLMTEVVLLQME